MAQRFNWLGGGFFDVGTTTGVQTVNLCQVDIPANSAGIIHFMIVGRDTTTGTDFAIFEVAVGVARAGAGAAIGAAIPALVTQVGANLVGVVAPVLAANGNGVRCPCVGIANKTIEWQVAAWGIVN